MDRLNLPAADLKIIRENGNTLIFDVLRRKNVVLTPEEWVRQHFIHYAIDHLGYPKSLIKVEAGHINNTMKRRTDLLLYSNLGVPLVLVECKKSDETVNQKAINQAVRYNNVIKASFVIITNGITSYCVFFDEKEGTYQFIESVPSYKKILESQAR